MNLGKRWLLAMLAAGAAIGAAGCDAVAADAEKAVRAGIEAESKESLITASWKWKMGEDQEEIDPLDELVRTGRVEMKVKRENWRTLSAEGTLVLSAGALPFSLYQNGDAIVLDVEGMKVPQRLDVRKLINERTAWHGAGFGLGDLLVATEAGSGKPAYLLAAAFAAEHLPQAERVKVNPVTDRTGDRERELQQITVEVKGAEALRLAAAAASRILSDEEGLRELVGSIYDGMKPAMERKLEERTDDVLLRMALQNKDVAVVYLTSQLSKLASETAAKLGSMEADDEALRLSAEWLVDGGRLVESSLTLDLALPSGGALELAVNERYLKLNETVQAETYSGPTGEPYMERKPRERLTDVETDSLLYDILKNQLRITTHSFKMFMGENAKVPDGVSPYIKGAGTTMVPVRYVSEQLDAAVHWDPETSTITIFDEADGIRIQMQIGSRTAEVNGEKRQLAEAPEIVFQTTFVPIAFITEALNGEARWDPASRTVIITKEF